MKIDINFISVIGVYHEQSNILPINIVLHARRKIVSTGNNFEHFCLEPGALTTAVINDIFF